jgi:hypothetical protein
MRESVLVVAGFCLLACGPKSEPATGGEAPPTPALAATPALTATPAPSATPAPADVAPSQPAPPSNPAPEAKPAQPSIHDVCFAMCDKVKAKCPQSAFESCRINCSKYDPPPTGCDEVVRSALLCARDAADLVCANVAPESCAKSFRQIAACASGQKSVASSEPSVAALPAGFAIYENRGEGVRAPMPEGAAAGGEGVLATAKHAGGAVYSIRKLPRPAGKLNEKVFLKLGLNLFGRCSDKMKLQGMVDKPGRTSINYTTKCPDGSAEQGLFWATEKALFVATVKGSGDLGPSDAFLYGFEAK